MKEGEVHNLDHESCNEDYHTSKEDVGDTDTGDQMTDTLDRGHGGWTGQPGVARVGDALAFSALRHGVGYFIQLLVSCISDLYTY
jgi:hypothetical protein